MSDVGGDLLIYLQCQLSDPDSRKKLRPHVDMDISGHGHLWTGPYLDELGWHRDEPYAEPDLPALRLCTLNACWLQTAQMAPVRIEI